MGRHLGSARNGLAVVAAAALGVCFAGAITSVAGAAQSPPATGRLVSSLHLRSLSPAQARSELGDGGFDAGAVRQGVELYRLVYSTTDAGGAPTTASGLLALPEVGKSLRLVSFDHGTEVYRADAPSTSQDPWAIAPAITYAAAGFAAVAPDFLGLGVGPGTHPWMDVRTEGSASLDLLSAAKTFALKTGRTLQRDVDVTGFSQGADAAVALAARLSDGDDPWFRLGALAPVSGAYDLQDVEMPALLSGSVAAPWNVAYVAYWLVAQDRLRHFYDRPGDFFRDPGVPALLDGLHPGKEILPALPGTVDELLTPAGLTALQHPTGVVAAALQAHDGVCDVELHRPVKLFDASGDDQVPNANTAHCLADLRSAGSSPSMLSVADVGDVDHLDSNRRGTAAVLAWFRQQG